MPSLMDRKRADERKLRAEIAADPAKQAKFGKLWDEVAAAYREYATFFKPYYLLEASPGDTELLGIAREIVRYAEETRKPNDQRLRGYQDSNLKSLEQGMYSTAPLSNPLEELMLAEYFRFLSQELGAERSHREGGTRGPHTGASRARLRRDQQKSRTWMNASGWRTAWIW